MQRNVIGVIVKTSTALTALVLVSIVVGKKLQQRNLEQQVSAALASDDVTSRIEAIAHLRDTHRAETLEILIRSLDDPDRKVHTRAGSALAMFQQEVGDATPSIAAHLRASPYPQVRLSCAIVLMSNMSPEVDEAYRSALHDSNDHVASIAATELAHNGANGNAEALFAVLDHPSWNVRLEICKALIVMKKADNRVVSALETMSRDPEAARYDAQIDEFDRIDKQSGTPFDKGKHWGKLDTILQQARDIAAGG